MAGGATPPSPPPSPPPAGRGAPAPRRFRLDRVDDVSHLQELLFERHAVRAAHLGETRAVRLLLLQLPVRLDGAEDRDPGAVLLREQDRVARRIRDVPLWRVHDEDPLDPLPEAHRFEHDDVAGGLLDEAVHVRPEDPPLPPSAPPAEDEEVRLVLADDVEESARR